MATQKRKPQDGIETRDLTLGENEAVQVKGGAALVGTTDRVLNFTQKVSVSPADSQLNI